MVNSLAIEWMNGEGRTAAPVVRRVEREEIDPN